MVVFWILASVMTAVALAFVLVPLLRPRPASGPSVVEANLAVLRGQRREIEADVANGVLPAEARDEALSELVQRAEDDLKAPAADERAPTVRKPWLTAAVVAVALPALAFGLYLTVGTPAATNAQLLAHEATDEKQVVAMVDELAKKVRDRPNDVQGWTLLARSLTALGRFDEAVRAYEHLLKITTPDPGLLSDYADALAMVQGRNLEGRPYELIKQALQLDPRYPKALALAGTAALDAGDYKDSLGYWQALAAQLPAGTEDANRAQAVIQEVRDRAKAAGVTLPDAPVQVAANARVAAPAKGAPAPAAAKGASVTGSVTLAPDIASKVKPSDTLFILARAADGPKVPLAVVRGTAAELPMKFALDDSQAMAPNMKLSAFDAVRIEAHISHSGTANPQPGDLLGTSAVVKPGAKDVRVVVDKVVP